MFDVHCANCMSIYQLSIYTKHTTKERGQCQILVNTTVSWQELYSCSAGVVEMSFSREIAFVLLIVYRIPSSCLIGLINLFAHFFFSGNLFLFAFTNEYSVALILRKFFKPAILIL